MKFLTNEKSQIISASGQMKCQESAQVLMISPAVSAILENMENKYLLKA